MHDTEGFDSLGGLIDRANVWTSWITVLGYRNEPHFRRPCRLITAWVRASQRTALFYGDKPSCIANASVAFCVMVRSVAAIASVLLAAVYHAAHVILSMQKSSRSKWCEDEYLGLGGLAL